MISARHDRHAAGEWACQIERQCACGDCQGHALDRRLIDVRDAELQAACQRRKRRLLHGERGGAGDNRGRVGGQIEGNGDRLSDTAHFSGTVGLAVILPTNNVGKGRLAGGIDRREVGVGAVGEFGCPAPATVELVEVTGAGRVGIVLAIAAKRVVRTYGRASILALLCGRHGVHAVSRCACRRCAQLGTGELGSPARQRGASRDRSQRETGLHPGDGAVRVVRVRVAIWAIDRIAVESPANDCGVMKPRRALRKVPVEPLAPCQIVDGGIVREVVGRSHVVDVVVELGPEGDRVFVIVVFAVARLVPVAHIKRHCLNRRGQTIEETVTRRGANLARGRMGIGEGVARIEQGDTIDCDADGAPPRERMGDGRVGLVQLDFVDRILVLRKVLKRRRVGGIAPPGSHDVARQIGRVDVHRIGGV